MNRVRKTMWQLMALLCLLVMVTGCGKKMVKGDSTSPHYAQLGEQVHTYGHMRSHSTIMKDGVVDDENMQFGENTINLLAGESENKLGKAADGSGDNVTGNLLAMSSSSGYGPDGSIPEQGQESSIAELGRDGTMKEVSSKDKSLDVVTMSLSSTGSGDTLGLLEGLGKKSEFIDGGQSEDRLLQKDAGLSRDLRDIHFDFDSWRLSDQAREVLEVNADWLKTHPHEHVTIEGHCDERGTQSYNYVLGEKRAAMVQEYLSHLGVPLEQLYVASYGKDRPACRTLTADCFDQNRRAHFRASVNMVSQTLPVVTTR